MMRIFKAGRWVLIVSGLCLVLGLGKTEAKAADPKMIQIAIEVVEVNNTKMLALGINWGGPQRVLSTDPELLGWPITGGIDTGIIRASETLPPGLFHKSANLYHIGSIRRIDFIRAELKALEEKGVARMLSNPKLVTKSGTTAKFTVGGEIPVQVIDQGTTSIEWKEYGIILEVTPTVDKKGNIDAEIKAEVKDLDWSNQVAGNPALSSRTVETHVFIKDGDTIIIAGLVKTKKEKNFVGIPGLSKIPWFGVLFGRQIWVDDKTTVVFFVTPTIVKR